MCDWLPVEVDGDVSFASSDLSEPQWRHFAPHSEGFPEDVSNLFLPHLPRKPRDSCACAERKPLLPSPFLQDEVDINDPRASQYLFNYQIYATATCALTSKPILILPLLMYLLYFITSYYFCPFLCVFLQGNTIANFEYLMLTLAHLGFLDILLIFFTTNSTLLYNRSSNLSVVKTLIK